MSRCCFCLKTSSHGSQGSAGEARHSESSSSMAVGEESSDSSGKVGDGVQAMLRMSQAQAVG